MSIESKHAYRFKFLKSEKWSAVRLEALVREKGKCQICGLESISNDAHHIWYPEDIYGTLEKHLAILCRPCHEFCHAVLPECKTRHENKGLQQWTLFRNAVSAWRVAKDDLFNNSNGCPTVTPKHLLQEVHDLKQWLASQPQQNGTVTVSKAAFGLKISKLKSLASEQPVS